MLIKSKIVLFGLCAVFVLGACGADEAQDTETRTDPTMMGGKADIPSWLRHIPTEWGCDQTLSGDFQGLDSAHLYSFAGKIGYEYTFEFKADYAKHRGAALAVFDAETGNSVALARHPYGKSATITYVAEKNVKYLVAVYSVRWYATGSYTLSVACKLLGCSGNQDCAQGEFCMFDSGCGATAGVCMTQPIACYKILRPVCGCDGRNYDNDCMANNHGISVDYEGECTKPDVTLTLKSRGAMSGDAVEGTIHNNSAESIFLPGCVVFDREEYVNNTWIPMGPDKVCVWEGYAVEVKAGESFTDHTYFMSRNGTFRLAAHISAGCTPGQPLSQANCTSSFTVYSETILVKDCPLLMMPNPETFCPDGDIVPVLDGDEICVMGYECKPSCFTTGCSGQVCADTSVITTCDFPMWYSCLGLSECGRFGDGGVCGWNPTPEYLSCMASFGM